MKSFNRIFILLGFLAILFSATGAHAQTILDPNATTPVTNAEANAFFNECVEDGLPVGSEEDLMSFCACTSAFMKDFMTQQDMAVLYEKTERGEKAWSKMMVHVYGPCLEFPVTAQIYEQCITDKRYFGVVNDMYKLCNCTTDAIRRFTTLYGPDLLNKIVTKEPHKRDPVFFFIDSPEFKRELQKKKGSCTAEAIEIEEDEEKNKVDIVLPQNP